MKTISRQVAAYGLDKKTASEIVLAVISWYEEVRKVKMRIATQGQKVGRPRRMTSQQVDLARRLRAQGLSYRAIGDRLGIKHHTVWYELRPPAARARIMKRLRANVDRWRAEREIAV